MPDTGQTAVPLLPDTTVINQGTGLDTGLDTGQTAVPLLSDTTVINQDTR